MNLRNIDLNLLVILDALLAEQNVSRAGERVGLSQSAMSAALARLRHVFSDPLLIRAGRGLTPTKKAEALIDPLRDALTAIEKTLAQNRDFDPAKDPRTFSIGASDYAVLVLLAPLVRALSAEAPNITVHLLPRSSNAAGLLKAGQADLIIEPDALFDETDFPCRPLFTDRWLCAVDGNSIYAKKGSITEEQFLQSPHLIYGIGMDRQMNLADLHLLKAGVERRIEVTVESFLLAPLLIEGTALVSLVLERAATRFSDLATVRLLEPPLALPDIVETMYWHSRNEVDPAHRWLRQRILAIAADLVPPAAKLTKRNRKKAGAS